MLTTDITVCVNGWIYKNVNGCNRKNQSSCLWIFEVSLIFSFTISCVTVALLTLVMRVLSLQKRWYSYLEALLYRWKVIINNDYANIFLSLLCVLSNLNTQELLMCIRNEITEKLGNWPLACTQPLILVGLE